MAVCLGERGYPLVCDDVCVISIAEDGTVLVAAADARVKLWEDGLESLKLDVDGLRSVREDMPKYHVPVRGLVGQDPIGLAAVYVLAERGGERSIEVLRGFDAMMAVAQNTYRAEFIEPLGLARAHFARCGSVARGARIGRLTRPRDFQALDRIVADLEADWRALGVTGAAARPMQE
jgi:hypothetical protein